MSVTIKTAESLLSVITLHYLQIPLKPRFHINNLKYQYTYLFISIRNFISKQKI